MAFFGDLFGFNQAKRAGGYGGTMPYSTFEDAPTGKNLRKNIEDRLSGIGVGYDPEVLNASTAPYAKAEREQFQNYTVPTISQQASARGLGRSTIPVNQIKQGAGELENRIGERVANLTLANEQQKRSEINDALNKYYQFTQDDVSTRALRAQFEYADYLTQIGLDQQAEQARTAATQKLTQTIGGVVGGVAGFALGGPAGAMAGMNLGQSITSGSRMNTTDLSNYMKMLQQPNASVVNKGYGNWGGGSWSGG